MKKITIVDYESAIKARYSEIIASGEADALLIGPTPGGLKKLCLLLFSELNGTDMEAYKRFFMLKDGADAYRQIDNFETAKFKALCKFLNGESDTTATDRLELLAVLINFQPRPYRKFLSANGNSQILMVSEPPAAYGEEGSREDIIIEDKHFSDEESGDATDESPVVPAAAHYIQSEKQEETETTAAPKKFISLNNNSGIRANHLKLIVILLLIAFGVMFTISTMRPQKGCMIWKGNHYEEVECDVEVNAFAGSNVMPADQKLLLYQKKIIPTDTTTYFNADGTPRIWYGKGADKQYEYFTYPGRHPETRKDLTKISNYMIYNHIKNKR